LDFACRADVRLAATSKALRARSHPREGTRDTDSDPASGVGRSAWAACGGAQHLETAAGS
jgi:hypothetical protein